MFFYMTENVTFTFLPLSHYPLLFAFPLDTFRPTQSILYVASHLCVHHIGIWISHGKQAIVGSVLFCLT